MSKVSDLRAWLERNYLPDESIDNIDLEKMYVLPNSTFADKKGICFTF